MENMRESLNISTPRPIKFIVYTVKTLQLFQHNLILKLKITSYQEYIPMYKQNKVSFSLSFYLILFIHTLNYVETIVEY